MTEKYEYYSTVPRTFVRDCRWYIFYGFKEEEGNFQSYYLEN